MQSVRSSYPKASLATKASGTVHSFWTNLVIDLPLLRVLQGIIRLTNFLKLFLSSFITLDTKTGSTILKDVTRHGRGVSYSQA